MTDAATYRLQHPLSNAAEPVAEAWVGSRSQDEIQGAIQTHLVQMVTCSEFGASCPIFMGMKVSFDILEMESSKAMNAEALAYASGLKTSAIPQDVEDRGVGKSDQSAEASMAVMPPTFEQESYKLTKQQAKRWDLSEKAWQEIGSRVAALDARDSEVRDVWCKYLVGAVYAYYKFHDVDLYHLNLQLDTNIQAAGSLEMWIELYFVA